VNHWNILSWVQNSELPAAFGLVLSCDSDGEVWDVEADEPDPAPAPEPAGAAADAVRLFQEPRISDLSIGMLTKRTFHKFLNLFVCETEL